MYVCVAGNGEMLVFFLVFFPNNSLFNRQFTFRLDFGEPGALIPCP